MEITLTQPSVAIPRRIRLRFEEVSQATQDALVAELYRAEKITFRQAQEILGQRWERTADILEQQGCTLYYDIDDLMDDRKTLATLLATNPA
jgi:predicted HTH domain antitoxin